MNSFADDPRYRAMNPREEGLFAPSIYGQSYRVPGGIASETRTSIGHQDAMGMARAQQSANAGALAQQLRPLQEAILETRAEGSGQPMLETERAAMVQAMLEIIQRPAWAQEERDAALQWMREMGALPPAPSENLEDSLFMPPGMR